MLGVTLFGIFLTPVFYYVIQRFGKPPTRIGQEPPGDAHALAVPAGPHDEPPLLPPPDDRS